MRHLIIIILIMNCLLASGQSRRNPELRVPPATYNKPDVYIASGILVGTFATLEINGDNMTERQRGITAMTGIATSVAFHMITTKIREKQSFKTRCHERIRSRRKIH